MTYFKSRNPEILLIEDNPGDAELTKEAFSFCQNKINVHWACDGDIAMDFLLQRNGFKNVLTPDLILLDFNLPGKDGKEVLYEVKRNLVLKKIPVIVFTSSQAQKDIIRAYNFHANCYLTKPSTLEKFKETALAIEQFWLQFAKIPDRQHYSKSQPCQERAAP